jgi:hypothetical protein
MHIIYVESLHAFSKLSNHVRLCLNFLFTPIDDLRSNLKQHRFVKICAVYTFLGWLATELTLFLNCRPLTGYWTIPPPQHECSTYFHYEIVQCVFNISSDIAILLVILPMLFRMRMPWRTKVPLIIGFSMGIGVVCSSSTFIRPENIRLT